MERIGCTSRLVEVRNASSQATNVPMGLSV
jgi:hypothetical protein